MKTSWLMLFMEIIAVVRENNIKLINTVCRQNADVFKVKAVADTCGNQCA
jgi:hypothetical protein